MKYNTYGRTGLKVSEIVIGGGNVGGLFIYGDEQTRRVAFRRALDLGINWIDTAPQYGDGISEENLGALLAECDPRPFISTKVRLEQDQLDDIPRAIEDSLRGSLKRLRLDSVDLLQLHNNIGTHAKGRTITLDHVLGPGGVADGLDRLRDQGLIRFTGFTAKGDSESCRLAADSGRFDSAQVIYNLLNPSARRDLPDPAASGAMPPLWRGQDFAGLMAACHRHGTATMVIRVFAAGIIATDARTGRESILTENTEIGEEERRARAVFAALGDTWGNRAQTAVRFALAEPRVACVNIGISEPGHIDEAVSAAALGPLPGGALEKLNALYKTDFHSG